MKLDDGLVRRRRCDEDEELIGRLKAGDISALDALIERHQALVYRAAMRVAGEPELAEEVTQDVFVALYKNVDKFRGDSKLSTWLYRVALNRARNAATSRVVRQSRQTRSLNETFMGAGDSTSSFGLLSKLEAGAPGPAERAAANERMRALRQAVEELSDSHREIIELRFFEDLAYDQIAERLEISLGTVKSRLSRARQDLSERLRVSAPELFEEYFPALPGSPAPAAAPGKEKPS
jgi:RNA polymerase sigma-70 factor (ECF subfamily)